MPPGKRCPRQKAQWTIQKGPELTGKKRTKVETAGKLFYACGEIITGKGEKVSGFIPEAREGKGRNAW